MRDDLLGRLLATMGVVCLGLALVGCASSGAQPRAQADEAPAALTDAASSAALLGSPIPSGSQAVVDPVAEPAAADEVDAAAGGAADAPPVGDEFFDPFAQKDEGAQAALDEYDPLESYNEVVFAFNYRFDKYLVKPLAQGYDFIMPDALQKGISNAFHNVRFVPRMINNLFQGKFKGAGLEMSRFLINTTVGVGGLFDPAKHWLELDTPDEDFGQTLGAYGVGPGAYVLIPFFPSPLTVRDAVGFVVDLSLDPFNYLVIPFVTVDDWPQLITNEDTTLILNWGLRGMENLNIRSLNLETFQGVEEAAVDLYGAVRNGYLQHRAKAIRE